MWRFFISVNDRSPQRREGRKEKHQIFIEKNLCALCAFAVRNNILGIIRSLLKAEHKIYARGGTP